MPSVEPYDIMPHSEIKELKKQIKELKEKPKNDKLVDSMNALAKSMDSMLHIFKTAAEEMKMEDREERDIGIHLKPLNKKIDELMEQNKILAEGMVALSDMVKTKLPDEKMQKTTIRSTRTIGPSDMPPPGYDQPRIMPASRGPPPMNDNKFPPPNDFGEMPPPNMAPPSMPPPGMPPSSMPPPPNDLGEMPPPPGGLSDDFGDLPPPPGFDDKPKKKGWR